MPEADKELFSLIATSPDNVQLQGTALLNGTAKAAAEFRRGIDLTAGFDFRGEARAKLGNDLAAQLAAGISLRGGVGLQVFFPLDLFVLIFDAERPINGLSIDQRLPAATVFTAFSAPRPPSWPSVALASVTISWFKLAACTHQFSLSSGLAHRGT